jgi:hypothetical protein
VNLGKSLIILLEGNEDKFCLKDGIGAVLNMALKMSCLNMHQLEIDNLNLGGVEGFKKRLLKTVCIVFQLSFLNTKLK